MPKSEVFNRDCLEAMREMPDKAFDLAIVDPPYGLNAANGGVGGKYLRLKLEAGTFESKPWDVFKPTSEYFNELQRVSERQCIWGGNYFNFASIPGYAIWDKGAGFRGRSFAECEMVWMNFKSSPKVFTYDPLANGDYVNKIHPTQKPIAVYRWLLQTYAKDGDTILDTHLGSGSSRIAAYDLGFDFTGYELDKDYFEAQERRFADHIAQPKLFVPEQTEATQGSLLS
jgi:site-specific DNA-methyltransferase (adenine-specific)